MFFGFLGAKPCRNIWKLPQKLSFGPETCEIEPKLWHRTCPDLPRPVQEYKSLSTASAFTGKLLKFGGTGPGESQKKCGSGYFKIGGRRRLRKTTCNSFVFLAEYFIGSYLILTPAYIIIVGPACFIGRCFGAFHLPKLCVPVVLSALAPAYVFISGLSAPP